MVRIDLESIRHLDNQRWSLNAFVRYLHITPEMIMENERLWREEHGLPPLPRSPVLLVNAPPRWRDATKR